MQMSRRARRMERHYQKAKTPALNLVSLMDIFTILVFFLLVSSSNTQQLPSNKDLRLPTSTSKTVPGENLIIAITPEQILLKGKPIARVENVLATKQATIPELAEELAIILQNTAALTAAATQAGEPENHSVTIMGDETISYELINRILTTCQQAKFNKIAFAAIQKAK